MATLDYKDKRKLERLFCMQTGYVLDFTDRSFREFFQDTLQLDIELECYKEDGTSKAKRLRKFWSIESSHIVGKSIEELILYGQSEHCLCTDADARDLTDDCWKIAQILMQNTAVVELSALTATINRHDFKVVAAEARQAIEKNQPEVGLDRLHTFLVKFIREIMKQHEITIDKEKPLHSIFGEYVKHLRDNECMESEMTEKILKSTISILEKFNHVRNNKSLAHDNPMLNYEESLLIFNHVTALIRFIKALERKFKTFSSIESIPF